MSRCFRQKERSDKVAEEALRQAADAIIREARVEVVIVVDEVYLHTCRLDRGNLDDERVIGIVNDEVHAGESYHFMQLVSAFVDISPFGHKRSDFSAFFLNSLR